MGGGVGSRVVVVFDIPTLSENSSKQRRRKKLATSERGPSQVVSRKHAVKKTRNQFHRVFFFLHHRKRGTQKYTWKGVFGVSSRLIFYTEGGFGWAARTSSLIFFFA